MFEDYFSEKEIVSLKKQPFKWLEVNGEIFSFLRHHWINNFEQIGFREIPEEMFEYILKSEMKSSEEIVEHLNGIPNSNKEFKRYARRSRRFGSKMDFNYEVTKSYMSEIVSILDFGCGKMAFLRKLAKENIDIKKFYGYDPKSNPEYMKFDERVAFLDEPKKVNTLEKIDLVYSSFVFHHLTKQEIDNALRLIFKVLKPGGLFIFLEETFSLANTSEKKGYILKEAGYEVEKTLVEQFNKLNTKDKFLAIYLNDVLMNLKNLSYMPWTFEYKAMENWARIIESNGFEKGEEEFFGIIKNGKLKQGITGFMVFKKI